MLEVKGVSQGAVLGCLTSQTPHFFDFERKSTQKTADSRVRKPRKCPLHKSLFA
ncbi:hypothetical protein EVA_13044 [gut metagenome]|uniref:Uncharacterized protein n=1 Tax=gut metagenome TaxID=749906 RepID=J9CFN7_9ZZZZ